MKKILFTLIVFVFVLIVNSQESQPDFEKNGEIYFKFEIESPKPIPDLTMIISIDNREELTIFAYANEKEFKSFLKLGYDYKILPHPNEGFNPKMATFDELQDSKAWDTYPTYEAYVAMMQQFEIDYPDICDVFSIGNSVDGRDLLVAKISDNVNSDENEPEFFYTSTMHGDETAGYIFMLRLIDSLLTSYGSAPRITNLVNNIEIYINPLANPDGTYQDDNSSVVGASRYNANGVDLNRNFPDVVSGLHPNTQPETYAFMAFEESKHFVMSCNMHSGAEVCNYPWDHKYPFTADDDWWQYVCREYADTAQAYSPSGYLTGENNGITNGAAWYVIDGGRQDYMNFFHQCREFTLELSYTKLLPESQLPAYWGYNYRSLLNYMKQVTFGIRGIVTDAITGQPVEAEIYILNHEINNDSSWVYSDLPVGNYHRQVFAGTYDIRFSAPCFETQVIQNVVVTNKNATVVDVQLQPDANAVDFTADQTNIAIGESVDFMDISCGTPVSWQWTFEGGAPSSSMLQNPSNIVYNTGGTYYVKLVISDGINSDSITKQNYITVSEEYLMTNGSFTTCSGIFYDSGGPDNEYSNYEDFTTTFYPSTPNGSIKVDFTMFNVEYHSSCDYDWLMIYDGPDDSAPFIGQYCGTNSPGTVLSTHGTGSLTFVFHSDYSVTEPGWVANISCEIEQIELDLKVFLEGPFNGSDMNTNLNGNPELVEGLPLSQPYNTSPWDYTGTESVGSIPNSDVVDWVLIELRDTTDASLATPETIMARQAAFLLNDGTVVGLNGSDMPWHVATVQTNNLFVVIWHRNHLGIMSANPLTDIGGIYSYDFSTSATQAYNSGQKNLGGFFGMYGGDANADNTINDQDKTGLWLTEAGLSGYLNSDLNLDGQSNNMDKNDIWQANYNEQCQVPE